MGWTQVSQIGTNIYLKKSTRLANQKPMDIYIYIYAFSRRFYPKRLTVHSGYTFFLSVCDN